VTTLRFSLRDKAKVSLTIYDAKGRLVRTLIRPDRPLLPGQYRLIWDARDDKGFEVPSGQYFYRFTAPKYVKTRKMILVK
jgi:flagellar hook assembly protein FlgD